MKKALIVCYGGGHANMLAPVHQRLLAEGRMASTALALSIGKSTFSGLNLPFKTIADYGGLVMDSEAERYGEELAAKWHVDSSGLKRRESVIYLGASMRDLARELGENEARRRLQVQGRQAFLPLNTLEKIVEAERPDVIVTTNSPRMERAATLVGNRRGIATLNVHDDLGFFGRDYLLTGERIAVMSDITKDNLIAQGHDGGKIVVTGHPAFDKVPEELKTFRRDDLVRKFRLPPGPYLLLGTSQPGRRGEVMEMCPLACEAVASLGGYHLIVKPHPGEDADAYRSYAAGRPGDVTVVSGVNIRELLFISELLITFASTIMIESLLMGKPLISYNMTSGPDPLPFVRWGLGVEARTPDQLKTAVKTLTDNPNFHQEFAQARLKHFSDNIDGRAAQRIVGLIHQLGGL